MRQPITRLLLISGLLLFGGSVTAATAQSPAPAATTAPTAADQRLARDIVLRGVLLPGVTDPLLKSGVSSPKPEIVFVVQNDGKTAARARIGFIRDHFLGDVTVTGPVSGGTLVDRDGVATGTSVRLRAQYVVWTLTNDKQVSDVSRTWAARTPPLTKSTEAPAARELAAREAEREFERTLRSGVSTSVPFFMSGAYEFGSQQFNFIDASSLADSSLTAAAYAGNFSLGVLLAGSARSAEAPGVYFGGGIESYRRFKATAERDICRPIGTGGFECDKFRVGAPTEKKGQSAEFESRLWVASGTIGLNPKVGYDFKDKNWNIEMPMYFLKLVADADKPIFSAIPDLAGGVSVGWKSGAAGGPYVLFFIGPTFKLPGIK